VKAARVWLAPAYVLHQYAYRDTSRIVEVLTRQYGRMTLFARGASSPKSALRGVLRPFQRLLVSWSGKSEACPLVAAEVDGAFTQLASTRIMSGFYLNELLLKLTIRGDPNPEIFDSYEGCIQALCQGELEEPSLRCFEKRLLDHLGYGLELASTDSGQPIRLDQHYRFAAASGPEPCVAESDGAIYGQSLADLDAEFFNDARSLREAKRVLRAAIESCLEGRALKSREIMQAMHRRTLR